MQLFVIHIVTVTGNLCWPPLPHKTVSDLSDVYTTLLLSLQFISIAIAAIKVYCCKIIDNLLLNIALAYTS